MTATQVSNSLGQTNPANIPQFNWRQLAAFVALPVAWWFILLYGVYFILLRVEDRISPELSSNP